jgi:hypothetical protein
MEPQTRIVPVVLPKGATVRVEATLLAPLEQDVAGGEEIVRRLDEVGAAIEGVAGMVVSAMRAVKPTKASAEFAIEVGLQTGGITALLMKGSGKANLKIHLEWSDAPARGLGKGD